MVILTVDIIEIIRGLRRLQILIEKINLKSVATYDNVGATLDNLKQVNFIYGNNGAGKTTISEVIRKEENYPSCSIEWKNEKIATYVYNRNFVNENFHLENPIKGIFTLGKESIDIQTKIDTLKDEIRKHKEEISDLSKRCNTKNEEKMSIVEEFKEQCWEIKKDIDNDFKDLIEGYRSSKDKFMNKCIEASGSMEMELKSLDELKVKKKSLYDRPMEKVQLYQSIFCDEALENNQIFNRIIIGKKDVDLAQLITRLNISDWVQQGYEIV
jgi:wobble nucleotide-excising tRNase